MDLKLLMGACSFIVIFTLEYYRPHFKGRTHHFRHSIYNLSMSVLNGILGKFVFLYLNVFIFSLVYQNRIGILQQPAIPYPARAALAFALFDMWMYIWHRANHNIPILWKFHRAHHNDPEMDASTSLRLHPIEIIISSLARLPVYVLIGMDPVILSIYESVLIVSILFHHSNISIPAWLDGIIRNIIVTPDMHRMHHSVISKETNSNFSSILPVWDKLFSSFTGWSDTKLITIGLPVFRENIWQTPVGILAVPFLTPKIGDRRDYEKK